MEKMTLHVAAAPLAWDGRKFEAKSKAYLSLGEISLNKDKNEQTKEQDGLIV